MASSPKEGVVTFRSHEALCAPITALCFSATGEHVIAGPHRGALRAVCWCSGCVHSVTMAVSTTRLWVVGIGPCVVCFSAASHACLSLDVVLPHRVVHGIKLCGSACTYQRRCYQGLT